MMDRLLFGLVFVSALGCGLIAGVFFAFSAFVIKGLSRLPPGQGIGGMQSINIAAITPVFMIALFGTAALCAAVAVLAVSRWQRPGAAYLLTGGLLYIFGTILVTILFNVPRNEALANVDPTTSAGVKLWGVLPNGENLLPTVSHHQQSEEENEQKEQGLDLQA